jgi:hypothetical protein
MKINNNKFPAGFEDAKRFAQRLFSNLVGHFMKQEEHHRLIVRCVFHIQLAGIVLDVLNRRVVGHFPPYVF